MTTTLEVTMRDGSTLALEVTVLGERMAYGRLDVLVTPVSGSGQAWVSADRVKVSER